MFCHRCGGTVGKSIRLACSAIMAIEQWGFFRVSHLLWHGVSVYIGHLRGPMKHTYCWAVSSGAVIKCFKDLGLSWLGFEHTTFEIFKVVVISTVVTVCKHKWNHNRYWSITKYQKTMLTTNEVIASYFSFNHSYTKAIYLLIKMSSSL